MKKNVLLTFILFVFTQVCFSQLCINVVNDNGKAIIKYSEGGYISFYEKEKKLTNDTIVETFISGSIISISKDSIKINNYFIEKSYYIANNLIYTKTIDAEENYDLTGSYAINKICAIVKESKLKSFGIVTSVLGLSTFVISPITSMSFQNIDYFNTSNYLITSSLGIAIGIVGLVINKISKDKYIIINNLVPDIELIKKAKIINGKIYVIDENSVK